MAVHAARTGPVATALVAAVALVGALTGTAAAQNVTFDFFKTPSGRIVCQHTDGGRARDSFVACVIATGLKPAPPERPCTEGGYAGDRVFLGATDRVAVPDCAGDPGPLVARDQARVLRYGKTFRGAHGLRCTSRKRGLTCRNRRGHGFFLSRDRWSSFYPSSTSGWWPAATSASAPTPARTSGR
jgi:hypothetical protein